ncbi:MAG: hypothetical protein JSS66_01775 [Armatimonadetes bacterium]|nr:hypothetical protein [Armatimonadota bacterium]
MGWAVFSGFVVVFCGVLVWRWMNGRRQASYAAVVEYWVYSNAERIPPTPALMDAIVSKNPHNRPDQPAITAREGILFSDVRLHIALARRDKNPSAFRPDLFEEHAEPDAATLAALADSTSIAKVRYASQVPLKDNRQLQFLTHLADGVARLLKARLVYDTVAERFWDPTALANELTRDNNAERPDLHLRTLWNVSSDGCRAETLGLRKVGRSELVTALQEPDQETLIVSVVSEAATRMFRNPGISLPLEVLSFGDTFIVEQNGQLDGKTLVRLTRRQQLN